MNYLPELLALLQVIMIDVSLSGDNAIVIGMAAASLDPRRRMTAIAIGTVASILLRVLFSCMTVQALNLPYLSVVGGLLLLWVCWKMFHELNASDDGAEHARGSKKTLLQAAVQIVIADVSMSLDNVLAVAAASRQHIYIMAFGLVLSIGLMAVASSYIAILLQRWRWLNYVGLFIIFYLSLTMLYSFVHDQIW